MAAFDFNAEEVEPKQSFDPIPVGNYTAMITASEMKPTKKQNGHYLNIEWTIAEGEYQGRKLWTRLNLDNPNAQAVQIAQRELSTICRACGKLRISDSAELHDIPCVLNVRIDAGTANEPPSNEIKGYKAIDGTPSPAARASTTVSGRPAFNQNPQPQQQTATASRQPATSGAAPWKR